MVWRLASDSWHSNVPALICGPRHCRSLSDGVAGFTHGTAQVLHRTHLLHVRFGHHQQVSGRRSGWMTVAEFASHYEFTITGWPILFFELSQNGSSGRIRRHQNNKTKITMNDSAFPVRSAEVRRHLLQGLVLWSLRPDDICNIGACVVVITSWRHL